MKKILLSACFFYMAFSFSQISPTLAVGLETLTMNKGTIDVKVLTEIIMEKQRELKHEALRRFMFKLFPEANYTTKFYVQSCLNTLLYEKNPQVIEKEILELTTNYALSLGVTHAVIQSKSDPEIQKRLQELEVHYKIYNDSLFYDGAPIIRNSYAAYNPKNSVNEIQRNIEAKKKEMQPYLQNIKTGKLNREGFRKLKKLQRQKLRLERSMVRLNLNHRLSLQPAATTTDLPFGLVLDVVSVSLSEIEELQKKGFFKNKIDYRNETFYTSLTTAHKREKLKASLDGLSDEIIRKIRPYVAHYDVIREFLKDNKDKSGTDILAQLMDKNQKEARLFIKTNAGNTEWLETLIDKENPNQALEKAIAELIENNRSADLLNKTLGKLDRAKNDWDSKFVSLKSEAFKSLLGELKSANELQDAAKKISPLKLEAFPAINEVANDSLRMGLMAQNQELNAAINNLKSLDDAEAFRKTVSSFAEQIKAYNASFPQQAIDWAAYDKTQKIILDKTSQYKAFTELLKKEKSRLTKTLSQIENDNDGRYNTICAQSKRFNAAYLESELNEILDLITDQKDFNKNGLEASTLRKIALYLPDIHQKVKQIMVSQNLRLQDIHALENEVTRKIIELKILDESNKKAYESISNGLKSIVPLLKMKVIFEAEGLGKYNDELLTLFEFISNLNKLDKAETYQSIVNMLRDGSKKVEENLPNGEFKDSYTVFINAMKKYTLINPNAEKEYVEVDVVSFLSDLQQYYNRNSKSKFNLYLSLGLNQNFFVQNFTLPESTTNEVLNNISFASEKIGVKYRFHNFRKASGYEQVIKSDVYLNPKAPFINEFYGVAYGSGLLYTVANTTTNKNFNFPHIGFGLGLRFYNALDVNLTLGLPFVKGYNFGDNAFYGFGLDIPLGEYLEKLGSKK